MKKERIIGIDILKMIATFFVVSIHQIGMTHVLGMNMEGVRSFIIIFFRYTVMSCVPLFLIITGYLQNKKTVSKKFYKGIVTVLASYLFISVLAVIINVRVVGKQFDLLGAIIGVLNFSENNYAWYVEMFVGLYLLIPFLNYMYHGANTKTNKLLLIGIFSFFTIASSILIPFQTPKYIFDIIPDYWASMYPITYYFIGAFINEYRPKLNKAINIVLIACVGLFTTLLQFAIARGGEFVGYVMNGFNSLSAFLIAILIFVLVYEMNSKNKLVKYGVITISVSSFEIYLYSNLVEKILYPHISAYISYRLPIMIILVFVGSFICAKGQEFIFWCVTSLYSRINHNKQKIDEQVRT